MKSVICALITMCSCLGFAGQTKATVCHDEAFKYASSLARDDKQRITSSELGFFDQIGGVQTEGWIFSTKSRGVFVVLASADGLLPDQCRISLVYKR
jgi:hypothetical protein